MGIDALSDMGTDVPTTGMGAGMLFLSLFPAEIAAQWIAASNDEKPFKSRSSSVSGDLHWKFIAMLPSSETPVIRLTCRWNSAMPFGPGLTFSL
jgi:hypothetical protein